MTKPARPLPCPEGCAAAHHHITERTIDRWESGYEDSPHALLCRAGDLSDWAKQLAALYIGASTAAEGITVPEDPGLRDQHLLASILTDGGIDRILIHCGKAWLSVMMPFLADAEGEDGPTEGDRMMLTSACALADLTSIAVMIEESDKLAASGRIA